MFSQKTHDEGTCARSNTSRSAVALRRGRNSLILPKRHRRVNFRRRRKEGRTACGGCASLAKRGIAQVGGSPFPIKAYLNRLSAFFFETRGANENWLHFAPPGAQAPPCAWQKRTRRKGGFAVRGDQRSARWISGRFLKKAT